MFSGLRNVTYEYNSYQAPPNIIKFPLGQKRSKSPVLEQRNWDYVYQDEMPDNNIIYYDSNLRKFRTRSTTKKTYKTKSFNGPSNIKENNLQIHSYNMGRQLPLQGYQKRKEVGTPSYERVRKQEEFLCSRNPKDNRLVQNQNRYQMAQSTNVRGDNQIIYSEMNRKVNQDNQMWKSNNKIKISTNSVNRNNQYLSQGNSYNNEVRTEYKNRGQTYGRSDRDNYRKQNVNDSQRLIESRCVIKNTKGDLNKISGYKRESQSQNPNQRNDIKFKIQNSIPICNKKIEETKKRTTIPVKEPRCRRNEIIIRSVRNEKDSSYRRDEGSFRNEKKTLDANNRRNVISLKNPKNDIDTSNRRYEASIKNPIYTSNRRNNSGRKNETIDTNNRRNVASIKNAINDIDINNRRNVPSLKNSKNEIEGNNRRNVPSTKNVKNEIEMDGRKNEECTCDEKHEMNMDVRKNAECTCDDKNEIEMGGRRNGECVCDEQNDFNANNGRNDMYLKNQNDMDNQDNENLRKNIKIGGKINDNQNTNELAGKKLTDEEMKQLENYFAQLKGDNPVIDKDIEKLLKDKLADLPEGERGIILAKIMKKMGGKNADALKKKIETMVKDYKLSKDEQKKSGKQHNFEKDKNSLKENWGDEFKKKSIHKMKNEGNKLGRSKIVEGNTEIKNIGEIKFDGLFMDISKYEKSSRKENPFNGPSPFTKVYEERMIKIKEQICSYDEDKKGENQK